MKTRLDLILDLTMAFLDANGNDGDVEVIDAKKAASRALLSILRLDEVVIVKNYAVMITGGDLEIRRAVMAVRED